MKIAIVCGAKSSEFLAPFDDLSWEIWVLGNRIDRFADKRVTRIFEIHDDLSEHGNPLQYAQYIASKNIPMIVGEKFPVEAAHIRKFDFEASKALFGSTYLTSSTDYMISTALCEGASELGIYGVDMSVDDNEYFRQRPSVEAWIGFAKAKLGPANVYIPAVSPLGKSNYVEGRGAGGKPDFSTPPFTRKELSGMADVHSEKISGYMQQIEEATRAIQSHDGARQAYARLANIARAVEMGQQVNNLTDSFLVK